LNYLYGLDSDVVSSTKIARALGLGEVQVRKDLGGVCGKGGPRIGYRREQLIDDLEAALGTRSKTQVIVVGAGKLGLALSSYAGFGRFGLDIVAAFDIDAGEKDIKGSACPVLPMERLEEFCRNYDIRIGILTVPADAANDVCDKMVRCGITAIWNFAPVKLRVPDNVTVYNENLALSLAHLKSIANN
jgi:redox-sensing transcriptional repressor